MILNSNLKKLQVVLTAAATANNMNVMVNYADSTSGSTVDDMQISHTNGTTAVDICFAPEVGTRRNIKDILIHNLDTASKIVQISIVDNGTANRIHSATLQVGDTLGYSDSAGWYIMDLSGNIKTTSATTSAASVITSASAAAFAVGLNGATNPTFNVDNSTASQVAGVSVKGAVTGGVVTLTATDSGADASLALLPKGAGNVSITNPLVRHVPTAANATATLTAAQVKTGYITSTSAAATVLTLPTGTLLGSALSAVQGTVHELYIDNTAGASTVTIAVAVNGILSDAATTTAASFGQLTVAAGVTGQARFTLMFSSATAYTLTRTA